eukprot:524035-Alexandrium_andersonii.AAC.1
MPAVLLGQWMAQRAEDTTPSCTGSTTDRAAAMIIGNACHMLKGNGFHERERARKIFESQLREVQAQWAERAANFRKTGSWSP